MRAQFCFVFARKRVQNKLTVPLSAERNIVGHVEYVQMPKIVNSVIRYDTRILRSLIQKIQVIEKNLRIFTIKTLKMVVRPIQCGS